MLFILFTRRHVISVSTWSRVYNSLHHAWRSSAKTDTHTLRETHTETHAHRQICMHIYKHTMIHKDKEALCVCCFPVTAISIDLTQPHPTHTHTHTHHHHHVPLHQLPS